VFSGEESNKWGKMAATLSELENNEESVKCPKLNGDNYYRWAIRMKALCLRYGYWEAVKDGAVKVYRKPNKTRPVLFNRWYVYHWWYARILLLLFIS
jgi:hypothetical protein